MAERVESDSRGARYSALLLVVTGIALAGCVALAVGVTVRLVDVPRPRITADLSRLDGAAPDGTGAPGDRSLVGTLTPTASDLAAEDAAKLAAQRAARQQASRSKVRRAPRPAGDAPVATPSPTPPGPDPDGGRPSPDSPGFHLPWVHGR